MNSINKKLKNKRFWQKVSKKVSYSFLSFLSFFKYLVFAFVIGSFTYCGDDKIPIDLTILTNSVIIIRSQPQNISALPGTPVTFSISSFTDTGSAITYQWQSAPSGSTTFNDISGATNASYTTGLLTLPDNGRTYRVVLKCTGANDVVSKVVTLKVSNLIITSDPSDVTVAFSNTAMFRVEAASNTGSAITYQWQSAPNGSTTFNDISGATNASYTTPILEVANDNGKQYRVVVSSTGAIPVISDVATVMVVGITITSQPTNVVVTTLNIVTFSVVATTNIGTLSYQWQSAPSGSATFTNIVGATSASYTIPTILSVDVNTQYRVEVKTSGALGASITSSIVLVQVTPFTATIGGTGATNLTEDTNGILTNITSNFNSPQGITVDSSHNVYVAEGSHSIRKIKPNGDTSLIGGSIGTPGFREDTDGDLNAVTSQFHSPYGVAVDSSHNVYVADRTYNRIRKIKPNGDTVTIGGTGGASFAEDTDGNPNTVTSQFYFPSAVAVDSSLNVYVADTFNSRIRKIKPNGDTVTIGGTGGANFAEDTDGDLNTVTSQFNWPIGIAVDSVGNLYVADYNNNRIRKITTNGNTVTIGGTGVASFAEDTDGDLNTVTSQFNNPTGVAVDVLNNVYVADWANNRIRKIAPMGNTSTIGGTGVASFAEDTDGTLNTVTSQFNNPAGVAVDVLNHVYVADTRNNRIRVIIQ